MSKGRSGLFPNSRSNAKLLSAIAYNAVRHMINSSPGGKGKAMAIGAYDTKTGEIATAFAGQVPKKIHPDLIKRAESIGGIGSKGLTNKNTVGVCAEFHVINQLLLNGSKFSDIHLTTPIRPRTGKPQPYCANCQKMFEDIINKEDN